MERYEFTPMLGPAEHFPVGSVEWSQSISNRLQIATDTVSYEARALAGVPTWPAPRRPNGRPEPSVTILAVRPEHSFRLRCWNDGLARGGTRCSICS
jgi:hypothetical protein